MSKEKTGAELIATERQRQMDREGWTIEHDDRHSSKELAMAAWSYLIHATYDRPAGYRVPSGWPWEDSWWKPSQDQVRNLVKAGALIAAEIDRLQRKEGQQ